MDCRPQGSSVHGIILVRILEWVATSYFRVASPARDQTPSLLHFLHKQVDSLPLGHRESLYIYIYGEGNGTPLQCSCLEYPMDRGAWWAAVHGVATERLPFHFSLLCIGEGNGNPLQCSCLKNPRDRGAWWAAVYGVSQSRTRLT